MKKRTTSIQPDGKKTLAIEQLSEVYGGDAKEVGAKIGAAIGALFDTVLTPPTERIDRGD